MSARSSSGRLKESLRVRVLAADGGAGSRKQEPRAGGTGQAQCDRVVLATVPSQGLRST